jgi:hypothetical protein
MPATAAATPGRAPRARARPAAAAGPRGARRCPDQRPSDQLQEREPRPVARADGYALVDGDRPDGEHDRDRVVGTGLEAQQRGDPPRERRGPHHGEHRSRVGRRDDGADEHGQRGSIPSTAQLPSAVTAAVTTTPTVASSRRRAPPAAGRSAWWSDRPRTGSPAARRRRGHGPGAGRRAGSGRTRRCRPPSRSRGTATHRGPATGCRPWRPAPRSAGSRAAAATRPAAAGRRELSSTVRDLPDGAPGGAGRGGGTVGGPLGAAPHASSGSNSATAPGVRGGTTCPAGGSGRPRWA